MQEVTILKGSYRNQPLSDIKCILLKPIKFGAKGWFGNFSIPDMGTIRVQLPSEGSLAYHGQVVSDAIVQLQVEVEESITDEEIGSRIEDRFKILGEITNGVASDDVRSLIVSGAPGTGKSVGIQNILERSQGANNIEFNKVSGSIVSAYQLYQTLFDNSELNSVLILDDCDSLLFDVGCLNLLKAALESGNKPRVVSYHSDSVVQLGLPKSFVFDGRIIFITNINFQTVIDKDRNISKHLSALVDRSLYLDLTMHSKREIWCRIHTMVTKHGMLNDFNFDQKTIDLLLEYIKERRDDFRSYSLRTVIQLAQFVKTSPTGWRRMSEAFQIRPR